MPETVSQARPQRVNIYDQNGRIVATVDASRSRWMGCLLAECPQGHIFIIDDTADECPVCYPPRTDDRQVV